MLRLGLRRQTRRRQNKGQCHYWDAGENVMVAVNWRRTTIQAFSAGRRHVWTGH